MPRTSGAHQFAFSELRGSVLYKQAVRFPGHLICVRIVVALLLVMAIITTDGSFAWAQESDGNAASPLADVHGTVRSDTGVPVPNARVEVQGLVHEGASSDTNGAFDLRVPAGVYRLVVTKSGYQTATNASLVVSGTGVAVDIRLTKQTSDKLKEIGRVSTSSDANHFNITPASVTTVTAQTFLDQGQDSLRRILEEIPGVSVASPNSWYNGGFFVNSVGTYVNPQIRGALSYETAQSIDGFPLATADQYAGFNAGLITYVGLGQLNVIKGPGADSASINGAIGGSIDYVTANPTLKPTHLLSLSTDGYGGTTLKTSFSGSLLNGRLGYALGYGAVNTPGPLTGFSNYIIADDPSWVVNGQPISSCGSLPSCPVSAANPLVPGYSTHSAGTVYCCDHPLSLESQHSQFAKIVYHFSPSSSVDFAYLGTQFNSNEGGYRGDEYGYTIFTPPAGYSGALPAGSIITPDLFDGTSGLQQSLGAIEANFRTKLGPGYLRLGYLHLNQYASISYNSSPPQTFTAYGALTTGGTPPTIIGIANGTPVSAYYNFTFLESSFASSQDYIIDYRVPFGQNIIGASWTENSATPDTGFTYERPEDNLFLNGYPAHHYGQLTSTNNEFRIYSSFKPANNLDLQASLYANQYINRVSPLSPPSVGFSIPATPTQQAAIVPYINSFQNQYSYYDSPRIGMAFHPTPNTSYRLALGGSIAPIPIQVIGSGGLGVPTANSASSPTFYTQSIPSVGLTPETAFGYDVGADVRIPAVAAVISADAYLTNLQGQYITQLTQSGAFNNLPLYLSQTVNLSRSRYEGLELSIRRDVPRGLGFVLSGFVERGYPYDLPANFYLNPKTGAPYGQNLSIINGVNFNNGAGTSGGVDGGSSIAVPYSGGYGELSYRFRNDGLLLLGATYYGPNNTYFHPPFFVLNASARVGLTKNIALQASIDNIGNLYTSPFIGVGSELPGVPAPLAGGQSQYSPSIPVGKETFRLGLTLR